MRRSQRKESDGEPPVVRGYKVFDKDWRCRGYQYEVGKEFRLEEGRKLEMCECGFHFCRKAVDCFNYQQFSPENKCAEVAAVGTVIELGDKCVTDAIRIVREIGWHEMLDMCNTGHGNTGRCNSGDYNSGTYNSGDCNSGAYNSGTCNSGACNSGDGNSGDYNSGDDNSGSHNSGDHNSGDGNSGDYNSGDGNSGDYNSGDCNCGDWNSGDGNSGYLNTDAPKLRIFNRETDVPRGSIMFPKFFYAVSCCQWKDADDMLEHENNEHPEYETTGGFLRMIEYKEAWREAFNAAKNSDDWEREKAKLLALPNFDFEIFEEITGITKRDIMDKNITRRRKK